MIPAAVVGAEQQSSFLINGPFDQHTLDEWAICGVLFRACGVSIWRVATRASVVISSSWDLHRLSVNRAVSVRVTCGLISRVVYTRDVQSVKAGEAEAQMIKKSQCLGSVSSFRHW